MLTKRQKIILKWITWTLILPAVMVIGIITEVMEYYTAYKHRINYFGVE